MTIRKVAPPYDPSKPPMGTRLQIGQVAAELRVTMDQLATAARVSKTAMVGIVTENRWPVRTDEAQIRAALVDLLKAHGANDLQLARLFWAQGARPRREQHHDGNPDLAPFQLSRTDAFGRSRDGTPLPAAHDAEELDMLMLKQTLSPQAVRHFKLFRNPFGEVTSTEAMFESDYIRYVHEAAWQCCQNSGFTAIVGESGAGKTTILAELEARLEREGQNVVVVRPKVLGMEQSNAKGQALKSADILHAILTKLEPDRPMPQTMPARSERTHKLLAEGTKTGTLYLLLIEEAHGLPDATLKHLKRLHELRSGRHGLVGILLLGQPELKSRLAAGLRNGTLREVSQRCEIVELLPLDNDLRAYLERRVEAVGRKLDELMDEGAINQVRARLTMRKADGAVSMCYPLAVNNLVTRALNAAAELGVPKVTKDVVAGV